MLSTARIPTSTFRDSDQEMDSNGQLREGYLNLTRRMENEEEDQFDVDLTILDFLVYKAIGLVFEWKASSDPYHSDLPNALVSMTAGVSLMTSSLVGTDDGRLENLPWIQTLWPSFG
jgi:hypothetical protein